MVLYSSSDKVGLCSSKATLSLQAICKQNLTKEKFTSLYSNLTLGVRET